MIFIKRKPINRRVERRAPIVDHPRNYLDWMKMAGGVLFSALALFGIFRLTGSAHFGVNHVEITGPFRHAQGSEIAALAQIPAGKNLFFINLYEVGKKISRHPWVDHVSVRREFPHTLSIHVDEFEPVAILEAGADYYINQEGTIFKRLESDDSRAFPKISGFESGKLQKFPFYYRPQVLEAMEFLYRLKTITGNEGMVVTALNRDEAEGYLATLCRNSACGTVFFGKDDYAEKMTTWIRFVRTLDEDKTWFKEVDLHVHGKIFARI